jgi:hypothetical protein
MNYKYNELAYATKVYTNGFQTKHISTELRLLVMYYRDVLNMKPKERDEKTYEFCKKYINDFKKEKYFKTINRALKEGGDRKRTFINIDFIEIYKGEIDYINSLEIDYDYKKVMFTFLVQLKLNKTVYEYRNGKEFDSIYFKGGQRQYANIKKISNINSKTLINDEVINELAKLQLMTIVHKGMVVLDYLKSCKQEGDIVIKVADYDNVGLYFDYYNGVAGIYQCQGENCNYLFKTTANNFKYCKSCAKEMLNELKRETWHKNKQKYRPAR